jgi:uncharacterized protein (DUF362 family)
MSSLAAVATGCSSSCGSSRLAGIPTGGKPVAQVAPRRPAPSSEARVVVVRAKKTLTQGYDADRGALRAMLSAGLAVLAGTSDGVTALRRYLRAGQTVGLKVNGLAGRNAATHVELVEELSLLLQQMDIGGHQQIAFDRFASDLTASGFKLNQRGDGYRCVGNDGLGYEDEPTVMPSSASRLARVLTERVDVVVNLPVLKQHMLSGMSGALKNQFGCIHNPNKMHLDKCDPYVAEVNALPAIRDKQRLIVMDALRPVVDKGPSYQPGMGEVANALLFAVDPVAVDVVGLEMLEDLRRRRGLPPLDKIDLAPTHIQTSAKMGLGQCQRAAIDLVSIEV